MQCPRAPSPPRSRLCAFVGRASAVSHRPQPFALSPLRFAPPARPRGGGGKSMRCPFRPRPRSAAAGCMRRRFRAIRPTASFCSTRQLLPPGPCLPSLSLPLLVALLSVLAPSLLAPFRARARHRSRLHSGYQLCTACRRPAFASAKVRTENSSLCLSFHTHAPRSPGSLDLFWHQTHFQGGALASIPTSPGPRSALCHLCLATLRFFLSG